MPIRIVKLEYNDGTVEYQIRIENCRGGFDPVYHDGKALAFDTFEKAYKLLNPEDEHRTWNPYVINETVVYEKD
jgi:hypothetical protein